VYVVIVILTYFKNGRIEVTACLHQILDQTGENGMETFKIMKAAFGEQIVFSTQVLSDFLMLKNGVMSVKNAKCIGLPPRSKTDESVDKVHELFLKNRGTTACEVTNMLKFYLG
jgi:hypothetical protein